MNSGSDVFGNLTGTDAHGNADDKNIQGERPKDIHGNVAKDIFGNEIGSQNEEE